MLSPDQILGGFALVIVLALGCELVAARTRLPAIVLLLPAGFIAGAITSDTHPALLFGNTFEPVFVSLGVGLILFEAGLRLRFDELEGDARRVVPVLITTGLVVTSVGVTFAVRLLFGLGWGSSIVIGAVLVVSGPTVVLPLLAFVRPTDRVRTILKWEGVLIDPIGALVGVIAFTAVLNSPGKAFSFHPEDLLVSVAVGLLSGLLGAWILLALLGGIQRASPKQSVAAALMVVTAAVAGADLLREDSGFVAATAMGIVLTNQRTLDVSSVLEFEGTVVQLLIGVLFVLISASVAPSTISSLIGDGVALTAVMVLVIRPLAVWLGTLRSSLTWPERGFMGWLAPRGIVAAATASAFGPALAKAGIPDAQKVLPICFIAIFGTVAVYGLTAAPVGRRLGVAGKSTKASVLVMGGQGWARRLAAALEEAGVPTRVWTWKAAELRAAREAGLTGLERLAVDVEAREAQLEDITDVLLLTSNDGFNALMAVELHRELGDDHVSRLAAAEMRDRVPAYARNRTLFGQKGNILFAEHLTYDELTRHFNDGAELVQLPPNSVPETDMPTDHMRLLFAISPAGDLHIVTSVPGRGPSPGDTTIWLATSEAGFRPAGFSKSAGGRAAEGSPEPSASA
jgi:NhaP-type Na+/H+ or K+/H+ antiporter